MKDSNSTLDSQIFGKEKLPEMLNVLTIITIGYSTLLFISGIVNHFVVPKMLSEINKEIDVNEIDFSEIGSPFIESLAKEGIGMIHLFPTLNLINVGVAVLCVLGAIFMRKLKRIGYFLYVLGVAVEIVIPIVIIGSKLIGGILVVGSTFSILFVILYSVNLKHLKY